MKNYLSMAVIFMMCVSAAFAENALLEQGSTVGIIVNDDRGGIIHSAFTMVLLAEGFMINNNNPDYLLNVQITITPLENPNPNMVYVRLELVANLLDNAGNVLLPYTISWRDGHFNQAGAENRAFREAVKKINDEYGKLFKNEQ